MKSLSTLVPDATRFAALSLGKQWVLVKAFAVLAGYKCLLFLFPFRYFIPSVAPSTHQKKLFADDHLHDTVWAIRVLSNRLPLGFTCLVQALAARWLLTDYADVCIRIGVHKNNEQAFSAHAWVVFGDRVILGEQTSDAFSPILDWN